MHKALVQVCHESLLAASQHTGEWPTVRGNISDTEKLGHTTLLSEAHSHYSQLMVLIYS